MSETFIHESAYVDDGAQVGPGTRIWHFCHVQDGARLGAGCSLGQNVNVAGGAVLGDRCKIQNNVSIYDAVTLEDDVFCGPSMVFTNVLTPRAHVSRRHEYRPTRIQQGASIGANATIVCGIIVGRYAMIGAGAVVTRNVPDFALIRGAPARLEGWVSHCGTKIPPGAQGRHVCATCGSVYEVSDAGVEMIEQKMPEGVHST